MIGRIEQGVTFTVTDEYLVKAPTSEQREQIARRFGHLLSELILNPEANTMSNLQLWVGEPQYDLLRNTTALRLRITCDRWDVPRQALRQFPTPYDVVDPRMIAPEPAQALGNWSPREIER